MAQRVKLDIGAIEAHYRIEEDGSVWSLRMGRYVKPTYCGGYYDYYYVSLHDAGIGMVSVHKVVASKFIGVCPDGCEISHKDGNKWNNHWGNLEYITHSANLLKSFSEHGRKPPPGNRILPSWETKQLMSAAKKKKVVSSGGEVWGSLNECAAALGYSRVGLYYSMKRGLPLKLGFSLRYV
jgi:hypothetical protein